jgi:hypothetical protein
VLNQRGLVLKTGGLGASMDKARMRDRAATAKYSLLDSPDARCGAVALPTEHSLHANDVEGEEEPRAAEGAEELAGDVLPTIFLDSDFHLVLDEAMRAMASGDPMLFAKGDHHVRVARDDNSIRDRRTITTTHPSCSLGAEAAS